MHPLDDQTYISIGTFRRDGSMASAPVWAAATEGALYVFTEADAYKVKRLRRNPQLRAAACNLRGKVSGPWFAGTGRILEASESGLIESAYTAFRAKYGWQVRLADLLSKAAGRYEKRAMIELRLDTERVEGLD